MALAQPTIAIPALWALLETARARGVDVDAVGQRVGFERSLLDRASSTPAAERRLPISALHAVWRDVMGILRDPGFPVTVAQRMTLDSFELFGFLIKTSATVGEAFRRVERYSAVWSDHMNFATFDEGRKTFVRYQHATSVKDLGARCAVECVLSEVVGIARAITKADVPGLGVFFEHPRPAHLAVHEAHFRAPLVFGAPRHRIASRPGLADLADANAGWSHGALL